jgi:beta-glucosidase/6-phospho-beta-glucosidase/beta-galactosidase
MYNAISVVACRTGTVFNPVVPWGIRKELDWIRRNYDNPEVFITENGYSDAADVFGSLHDQQRIDFIRDYSNNVLKGHLPSSIWPIINILRMSPAD